MDNSGTKSPKNGCDASGQKEGLLYVVSTPIGNLEDITLRALRVLKDVDLIVAENPRHTRKLCEHYRIDRRIRQYNQHSSQKETAHLVELMKLGRSIALVSDAGTPGISDPGIRLIAHAAKQNIGVTPLPGPCAAIAGLSVCGFSTASFVFVGFLPNRPGKRIHELEKLAHEHRTMVFYEAPHRIKSTLSNMAGVFGSRQMVLLREVTKMFEEIQRGTADELLALLTPDKIRGEFTLVVSSEGRKPDSKPLDSDITDKIDALINDSNRSLKDIASLIAEEENMAYRRIYRECIARKRKPRKSS